MLHKPQTPPGVCAIPEQPTLHVPFYIKNYSTDLLWLSLDQSPWITAWWHHVSEVPAW